MCYVMIKTRLLYVILLHDHNKWITIENMYVCEIYRIFKHKYMIIVKLYMNIFISISVAVGVHCPLSITQHQDAFKKL